jgi:hypothetical protein
MQYNQHIVCGCQQPGLLQVPLDALFASHSSLYNLLPPMEFGMTMLLIKKGFFNPGPIIQK